MAGRSTQSPLGTKAGAMHSGGKALLALVPLLSLALGWMGCSSEEDGKPPPPSLGVPSLAIERVGDVSLPGASIDVTLGCDRRLPVVVTIESFTLRPPGACFGFPQCGQLLFVLDPSLPLEAGADASAGADEGALFYRSATRFTELDLAPLASLEGPHLLRVALVRDGTLDVSLGAEAKPLAEEVSLNLHLEECDAGELPDGGAPDASLDAEPGEDAEAPDAPPGESDAGEGTDAGDEADAGEPADGGGGEGEPPGDAGEEDAGG